MDIPITLDRMTLDQVPQVYALERLCFTAPWDAAAYYGELRNPSAYYIVAHQGELVVGYGGMWVIEENAHVVTVAVRPETRRQGLGRRLMEALIAEARRRGALEMTLEVRVNNLPAQTLYRNMDFRVVGRRRDYYPDNGEDALVMSKALIEP